MAISLVCRKCSRQYSDLEDSETAFCKQCGSLLIKQYTLKFGQDSHQFSESPKLSLKTVNSRKKIIPSTIQCAAERLREKSSSAKEYIIVSEPKTQVYDIGAKEQVVFKSDYEQALRFKAQLIDKYKDKRLEEVLEGNIITNTQGECYCVIDSHELVFKRTNFHECRKKLLAELKLIPGIGITREQQLKSQGYRTIADLSRHPKWRHNAGSFLNTVNIKDVFKLQEQLRYVLPKSHPLLHYLAGFCKDDNFTIVDIETLGLFGRPIILLGVAKVSNNLVVTRQYLIRSVSEEACVLSEFVSGLTVDSALISFNGRCFDVPFIRERLAYYGLECPNFLGAIHFDMLHFARRAFRGRFTDCRLETIESYLGISRSINIPSAVVPEFYDAYQRSGNVGPLIPIIKHNQQDLVTLAKLFFSLYQEYD